eukprot:TRINITY_DN4576_c0_g1_i7.p8 TRINITY_DN4576_c0_g1~~TRINITY_DN4576_c0_g1_i7.p8  ORF type:complete len:133 (-),score=8.16 TRINITY_DN4576_c0_g1_i7:420-818(-)
MLQNIRQETVLYTRSLFLCLQTLFVHYSCKIFFQVQICYSILFFSSTTNNIKICCVFSCQKLVRFCTKIKNFLRAGVWLQTFYEDLLMFADNQKFYFKQKDLEKYKNYHKHNTNVYAHTDNKLKYKIIVAYF